MQTLLIVFLAIAMQAPVGVGFVTRAIKSADLLRGKSTTAMKDRTEVAEGDKIRTQSTGRVRVVMNDGSILSVGSSSLLTVRSGNETVRPGSLELAYGKIRAVISPATTGLKSFEVRSATAVCGVLGTTLFIDGSRDVTRVANLSPEANSRVRVTSTNPNAPGEVILLPGQGTSVPLSGRPQPPRTWSPEEVRAANQDTDIP